jgi:hypothetical protein
MDGAVKALSSFEKKLVGVIFNEVISLSVQFGSIQYRLFYERSGMPNCNYFGQPLVAVRQLVGKFVIRGHKCISI